MCRNHIKIQENSVFNYYEGIRVGYSKTAHATHVYEAGTSQVYLIEWSTTVVAVQVNKSRLSRSGEKYRYTKKRLLQMFGSVIAIVREGTQYELRILRESACLEQWASLLASTTAMWTLLRCAHMGKLEHQNSTYRSGRQGNLRRTAR